MKTYIALILCSFSIQNVVLAQEVEIHSYPAHYENIAICKSQPVGFYGFKKEAKGLSLIRADFTQQNTTEDMTVIDLSNDDEKPKKCWVPKSKFDFPIFVKGLKVAPSSVLHSDFHGKLMPGDKKTISIGAQKYDLQFPQVSSGNYKCVLGESENLDLDGGGYEIVLAADLNNDQLPDFIVQNARKYSFHQYQILMSDKASKKCKAIATREVYSC